MKIIDDTIKAITSCDEERFKTILDNHVKEVSLRCPNCGRDIKTTEAYINKAQEKVIDMYIKMIKIAVESLYNAAVEVYGEDPRRILLERKLKAIQDDLLKPKLLMIKGKD